MSVLRDRRVRTGRDDVDRERGSRAMTPCCSSHAYVVVSESSTPGCATDAGGAIFVTCTRRAGDRGVRDGAGYERSDGNNRRENRAANLHDACSSRKEGPLRADLRHRPPVSPQAFVREGTHAAPGLATTQKPAGQRSENRHGGEVLASRRRTWKGVPHRARVQRVRVWRGGSGCGVDHASHASIFGRDGRGDDRGRARERRHRRAPRRRCR